MAMVTYFESHNYELDVLFPAINIKYMNLYPCSDIEAIIPGYTIADTVIYIYVDWGKKDV